MNMKYLLPLLLLSGCAAYSERGTGEGGRDEAARRSQNVPPGSIAGTKKPLAGGQFDGLNEQ